MTAESYALFRHLADVRQTEDLKTARVGQNRTVPSFEPMQAASFMQDLCPRTKIQMIGVSQNNLRLDILLQLLALNALHGTYRTNRHENRREDVAMIGVYYTGTSPHAFCLAM